MPDGIVRFVVPGQPVGKGRARFSRKTGRAYTPEKTVAYETLVRLAYRQQFSGNPFEKDTPLWMHVELYMQIPKNTSKRKTEAMIGKRIFPTKKPDCSNVLKAIEDGLNGVAYADDSQIVSEKVAKYYGEYPEAIVTIGKVGDKC